MRLIATTKRVAKRYWPSLSIRTILLGTFLFVAALPGVGAIGLRVYENTLVQQTEAELTAQGAVLAAAYRASWGDPAQGRRALAPEPPRIDLGTDKLLPPAPEPVPAGQADPRAISVGRALAPLVNDAAAVTLSTTRLLDGAGIVVAGSGDVGLSYADLPEIRRALGGEASTVLRKRDGYYQGRTPLAWLSRAVLVRVHHARPVLVGGRVVGVVMLSRSPRGLFLGIYQDRGKIAIGVLAIFATLLVLAALLSRGIAKPIRELTRATEAVARGEVAILDTPATAATEIRELYANFGAMAARIDARTRYLRDFAAAVSHEFKTPLAGIRGALELLAEHDMTEADRRRFLGNATDDAERLSRLVQRLLDLARADMASPQGGACDPHQVMRQVADATPALAVEVTGNEGAIAIDEQVLATVLAILVENSREAGATRATLDLRANVLRYQDDGPGIPPGDESRIFTPFFTSRRAQGCTGLGLAIARSLLSAGNASIELAESRRGATFVMEFGAADQ